MNLKRRIDRLGVEYSETAIKIYAQWLNQCKSLLSWEEFDTLFNNVFEACQDLKETDDFFRSIPPPIFDILVDDEQFRVLSLRFRSILQYYIDIGDL